MIYRYNIEIQRDRHAVATAIIRALLARSAIPILFARTARDAAEVARRTGLVFLDPARPSATARTIATMGSADPPPGVATTFAMLCGWRAPSATDVLFLNVPNEAELAQGEARARRRADGSHVYVGLIHFPHESVEGLLRVR
jgi:hypothetical protein